MNGNLKTGIITGSSVALIALAVYGWYQFEKLDLVSWDGSQAIVKYKGGFKSGTTTFNFKSGMPSSLALNNKFAITVTDWGEGNYIIALEKDGILLKSLTIKA